MAKTCSHAIGCPALAPLAIGRHGLGGFLQLTHLCLQVSQLRVMTKRVPMWAKNQPLRPDRLVGRDLAAL